MALLSVKIKNKVFDNNFVRDGKITGSTSRTNKIVMGTFSKAIDYAPYYVAKEKGLFKRIGVTLAHKVFSNINEVEKAFSDNELDVIFSAEAPIIFAEHKGAPVEIIGTTAYLRQFIFVHSNSGIDSVGDLKGKKIAVLKGTSSHFGVLRLLYQHKVDVADVTIIDASPQKAKIMFTESQVDAWAVWPPYSEQLLLSHDIRIIKDSDIHVSSVVAARDDLVVNNKKLLKKILRALDKSKQWINSNKIEAQELVSKFIDEPIDTVKKSWSNHNFKVEASTNLVLSDLSFSVNQGEFTTILGPSGCGKSTVLRLILGIDDKYDGEILINDKLGENSTEKINIMFQENRLLPWLTVKENVLFGSKQENTEEADRLLKTLDLSRFSNAYPHQLSGGMAKRVSLARAMIDPPTILLLDEPFTALDVVTKERLYSELRNIAKKSNTTILMVTHDLEEALYLSDKIYIMSRRPGSILRSFEVNLPPDRLKTGEEFVDMHSTILRHIQDELKLFLD